MRIMICIALCLGLGATGCAVIDDDVIESSEEASARNVPIDETFDVGLADFTSELPADVVEEMAAIGCPWNCVGICACQFRFCVRAGNDPIDCGNEQDLCLEACYE